MMGQNIFKVLLFCGFFTPSFLISQKPNQWAAGEIYQNLEKLNILASVLYVAAHPDDENTRLISYLSNHEKAETTYLSITRGDGGQNLIGKEIDEKLGVLRTQELLMARSVDHGNQMFTRANDFGYSKNAEETIDIWDTEKIKADVAWAIRTCKPDVIINRFDHRTSGQTHGHHTASALLSLEIFDVTNNTDYFPDQLKYVSPWQAKRIFFNTSWWFYGSQEKFEKADKSRLMGFDVGVYFPLLGQSNTEIAALSRSKHKCQGFGSTGTRGSQMEYLELLKGDMPANKQNIFDGINTTWTRVKGGEKIGLLVQKTIDNFNFKYPEKSIPALLEIHENILKIEDSFWKNIKLKECKALILACSGLYLEVKANVPNVTQGDSILIDIEAVKRLEVPVILQSVQSTFFNVDTVLKFNLEDNQKLFFSRAVAIPNNAHYTTPYWIRNTRTLGMYHVEKPEWIGKPETPKEADVTFKLLFGNITIPITKDVIYKYNSPESGELYRPFEVLPSIGVEFSDKVFIFPNDNPEKVSLVITNFEEQSLGFVTIPLPNGWKCIPEKHEFSISGRGQTKEVNFVIYPPKEAASILITPVVVVDGKKYSDAVELIKYDHIPHQLVQQLAIAKCVRLDVKTMPLKVGYIAGTGDVIPSYLIKLGYNVDMISEENIKLENLKQYQTIIFGVRAYNTIEMLKFKQSDILKYVEEGGKIVVQYNTSNSLNVKEIGPYPFKISRERVSVENAPMTFLLPSHAFLNYPNKISSLDFDNWVQERGLYFASDWDSRYETIFSCNDPGENPQEGSILYTTYGKGEFVYTGFSFFRQFPAGVSGAFRLFANIIQPKEKKNGETP
ncbi:MAG: PIG-L family deacetylase [Saprospiraceae bacterium]